MSTACDITPHSRRHVRRFQWSGPCRWAVLGALLLAEFVVLSLRFDTVSIEHVEATWATLLGHTWLAGQFAVSIVAVLIVFGGRRVTDAWERLVKQSATGGFPWQALAVHFASVMAFYTLSSQMLETGISQSRMAWPLFAAWSVAGALTLASWCTALIPLQHWRALIHRTRRILVLCICLALAALVAAFIAQYFWPLLGGPTMAAAAALLRLFYSDVALFPEEMEIRVRSFTVGVGPECSGFEGVGLIAVFVGAFMWSFRARLQFPQALALLPLGMGAIWCANVLRIATLVAIGASISESIAAGGFHSQAGWLAFNAVALGLVYVAWNTRIFRAADARDKSAVRYEYVAGPYLLPLLLLVAVMMITTAISARGFDWLYPLRIVAVLSAVAYFWPTYRNRGYLAWTWSWSPLLIGAAVFAMWMALEPFAPIAAHSNVQQSRALNSLSPAIAALWLVFRSLGSIVAIPMAEELAFRGFLLRKLIDDDFESVPLGAFTWYSLIVSSVLFGLLHGRWLAGTLAGVLFALALYRRRRLADPIVAHATANALITAYVLLTGNWAAWS